MGIAASGYGGQFDGCGKFSISLKMLMIYWPYFPKIQQQIFSQKKAGMLSASFSQSMVTLFASYSALGGLGLGLLHHHPENNHQFFINYSDHPHHWASHYDRDLKCQYQTLKTCLTYFSLSSLSETILNISNMIFAMYLLDYHDISSSST